MADSFVVHLGGGTYLDANGDLTFGLPSRAQVYQPPGGFNIDTKKIQDALKDLAGLLPQSEEDKEKWTKWGVPEGMVDFLSKIAGVAAPIATALAIYTWAIGVLLTIMKALTNEGLSPELAKALDSIKNQAIGQEDIARANNMIALHGQVDGRVDEINTLLMRLVIEGPVGTTRAGIFADMLKIVDGLSVPLSTIRDQEWAVSYDAEAFKGRAFASSLLVFQRSDGSLAPVPSESPTATAFDYRLGLPMLIYTATTYAAMLQVAMPWFRSAGMYARQLRTTAEAIDKFVLRIQDECLSRTNYTKEMFLGQQVYSIFELPLGGGPRSMWMPVLVYPCAVGAFDLAVYSDAFLLDRYGEEFAARQDTGSRGLFNYHWQAPSSLTFGQLEELAAAANEQARIDYANLQAASGTLKLIQTACWLRFLTTPPLTSQTVTGRTDHFEIPHGETPSKATSPEITLVGVIEHDATVRHFDASARALIATQEPGYVPAFRYRIVLRMLDSRFGKEGWHNLDYAGEVWHAEYEPCAGDPRCKRLRTTFDAAPVLSEIVLFEGPSPTALVERTGTQTVRAATFDWYVPIASPWTSVVGVAEKDISVNLDGTSTGTGGVSVHFGGPDRQAPIVRPASPKPPEPGPLLLRTFDAGFITNLGGDMKLDKAERRHVSVENVTITWSLNWAAEKLEIKLTGKREERPFQVMLVVEEAVYSGEIPPPDIDDVLAAQELRETIHTAFTAEVVNQVVLVPDAFFIKERNAIETSKEMLDEFERRFSREIRPGPIDPVISLRSRVSEMMARSQSTSTLALVLDERRTFAVRHAPELWDAVQRGERHG